MILRKRLGSSDSVSSFQETRWRGSEVRVPLGITVSPWEPWWMFEQGND